MSTSYQVFARQYRPLSFKDILGQDHVVRTLANAIEQNRLAHAYLFVGPRGTGKTSLARIVAKALNCQNGVDNLCSKNFCESCQSIIDGNNIDIIEVDGASSTSVNNIKELIEGSKYKPTSAKYKIYIILLI